jgi:hypothetical protein
MMIHNFTSNSLIFFYYLKTNYRKVFFNKSFNVGRIIIAPSDTGTFLQTVSDGIPLPYLRAYEWFGDANGKTSNTTCHNP